MKKVSLIIIFFILFLANIGFAQKKSGVTSPLKGTLTPDGYLGKIALDFNAGFESASGDHTNVTDGERQDMNISNFNLVTGIIYPATQTLTFRFNLGYINLNTNWDRTVFLDEHDFDLSGFKMNFGVRVYLR